MPQRSSWGTNAPAMRKGYRTLRYWANTGDGKGYRRHCLTVRGSKRHGDEVLRDLWKKYSDQCPSATMGRAYEQWWLPEAERRLEAGELAQNTMNLYLSTWRNHIAPRWGNESIDDIRQADVQEWLLSLSKWSASVAKSLASMIVRRAEMMERARRNPFDRSYAMPSKIEKRPKAIWSLEQMARAVSAAEGTVLYIPLVLCGLGSCRLGEGCAVQASEVSLTVEHGMRVARVPITRQLLKDGVSDTLKNKQSNRTVCIPEPWSVEVTRIAEENLSSGLHWLNDNGLGRPVSRAAIASAWSRFTVEGQERITMQNLRNSWETFMRWELGVDPDLIDAMMGHAGKSIRTQHYDRPAPDVFAEICALAHQGRFKRG